MTKKPSKPVQRLIAYIILAAACAIVALHLYTRIQNNVHALSRQEKQQQKVAQVQYEAALSSCIRLNIVRASDNRSHFADYHFFTLTTKLIANNLKHPTQPTTAAQRKQAEDYIGSLRESASDKTWVPLTDCSVAVTNPIGFKIPQAIPFTTKLPPNSALNVAAQQSSLAALLREVHAKR